MPIYEYECDQCGESFEKIVRFSDADQIPTCPECASTSTHKKISKVVSIGGSDLGASSSYDSGCGSQGGFT